MKKQIIDWWGGAGDPATNAQGQQVIVFLGDSNITGQGLVAGPTPTLGTVKEFDGTNIINVTNVDITKDLAGTPANVGSMLPKFGIDYNARTGKIPVLVSCGRGGSEFSDGGDTNNWSSTGANRATAQTKIANALTANGTTKVKEIIVNLGINDFSGVNSFATISADIDSFQAWLTTTYPNVRVTYLQIGRTSSYVVSLKQSQIRDKLRQLSEDNSNVLLLNAPVAMDGYAYYKADNLHYSQDGNNFLGAAIDNYFEAVDAGYNKFAASIFCSFKDAVNTTKKDAINVFVTKYYATNLALCETFQVFKSDTQANTYLDWVGMLQPTYSDIAFSANTEIATNATSDSYIDHQWMLDEQLIRCTDQDINIGCRMGSKTTGGSTACLFGAADGTNNTQIGLYQTTTPSLQWRMVNPLAVSTILTTAPDTTFIAESLYEMTRTGAATVSLYRNAAKIQDGTTAYEGGINRYVKSGGLGASASTISSGIAAGFKVFYVSQAAGFDRTDWDADLDTLLAAL